MGKYVLSIDQSTQGTKALLFDEQGILLERSDLSHQQIVNNKGWVSHNPMEIYGNCIQVVKDLVEKSGIDKNDIQCLGVTNQRETSVVWSHVTGEPIADAIVWQCARATEICEEVEEKGMAELIRTRTGMNLSPYFPASKYAWLLRNIEGAKEQEKKEELRYGTIDSWVVYKLTGGKVHKTDYSNASRTQLFNIIDLKWDEEICEIFGLNSKYLPEVCDSNALYGETDFDGYLDKPIPIHGVMGDSHGALFGQGCLKAGMIKATYGTGSSIMMNIGEKPVLSKHGVVTSLAWGLDGKVNYVLEGNINYSGAVITWLQKDLTLIESHKETQALAEEAEQNDGLYLVPAFTGLGAPYWNSKATGTLWGITRTTGKAEMVRAGLECIAYQITDIVEAMEKDTGIEVEELRVDGGPTSNGYLMQFQSDILECVVQIPNAEELSGIGVAYAAGIGSGQYTDKVFDQLERVKYTPVMEKEKRAVKYAGWLKVINKTIS